MYEQTYILVYFGNVIHILSSGLENMKDENALKYMYLTIKPNSKRKQSYIKCKQYYTSGAKLMLHETVFPCLE